MLWEPHLKGDNRRRSASASAFGSVRPSVRRLAEHYHQRGRRRRLRRVRLGPGWPGRLRLHPPPQQRYRRLQSRETRAEPGLRSDNCCSAAISLGVTGLGLGFGSGRGSSFNFTAKGPKLQEGKREGRKCAKDAGKRSLSPPAALRLARARGLHYPACTRAERGHRGRSVW